MMMEHEKVYFYYFVDDSGYHLSNTIAQVVSLDADTIVILHLSETGMKVRVTFGHEAEIVPEVPADDEDPGINEITRIKVNLVDFPDIEAYIDFENDQYPVFRPDTQLYCEYYPK